MFVARQLHLPNDLRSFHYHAPPTYSGPEALVFDGQALADQPIYARSYLFRQHWLEIFLTFDETFQFRPDPHVAFPFVFNCDLTTPYHVQDNDGYTIDLWLDVLVAADGHSYQVKDCEAFEAAACEGRIPLPWYHAVRRELIWLTDLLHSGQFIPLLEGLAPFPTQQPSKLLSTCIRTTPQAVNFPDLTSATFATNTVMPP